MQLHLEKLISILKNIINKGQSGYHEAGSNTFKFGRDVMINDEIWGRIYHTSKEEDNIILYVFRFGESDKVEKIILPNSSYSSDKVELTFNGRREEINELKK